jgi:MinD-like ATPase involved in chromosome partitioning or flagellar assembly
MATGKKKPIILAIVSGKGGSGKTTFSLALSALISKCRLNVALFDCDFVTNGGTFFFEQRWSSSDQKCFTTQDYVYGSEELLYHEDIKSKRPFYLANKYFRFIPSIYSVPDDYSLETGELTFAGIERFIEENSIDIVIFDCQAGYSLVTKFLLDHSTINLVVMEADAISTSANRVLYKKLAEQFDTKTTYQIMNKATEAEREKYANLPFGTTFTNLTPVLFDWHTRGCFTLNKLPEIGDDTFNFSIDMCNLACILFPMHRETFRKVILELYIDKRQKIAPEAEAEEKQMRAERKGENGRLIIMLSMVFVVAACAYFLFHSILTSISDSFLIIGFVILLAIVLAYSYSRSVLTKERNDYAEYKKRKTFVNDLTIQINELKREIEFYSDDGIANR